MIKILTKSTELRRIMFVDMELGPASAFELMQVNSRKKFLFRENIEIAIDLRDCKLINQQLVINKSKFKHPLLDSMAKPIQQLTLAKQDL